MGSSVVDGVSVMVDCPSVVKLSVVLPRPSVVARSSVVDGVSVIVICPSVVDCPSVVGPSVIMGVSVVTGRLVVCPSVVSPSVVERIVVDSSVVGSPVEGEEGKSVKPSVVFISVYYLWLARPSLSHLLLWSLPSN